MANRGIILAVFLLINGVICLNSCIQLPEEMLNPQLNDKKAGDHAVIDNLIRTTTGQAIDWWFIVKPPSTSSFLYFDSVMEASNPIQPMKEVPENVIDKYLLWHALNGHKENLGVLEQMVRTRDFEQIFEIEKAPEDFIPVLSLDAHVLQLHISNDRKTLRQKGSFETQRKVKPFRYSHGKGLFSVRLLEEDFGDSFYLQHSLTKVPNNEVRFGKLYLNSEVDYKLKSQHAFCTSIAREKVKSFMKTLAVSGPQVVILNLDRALVKFRVGDANMALIDKIVSPPFSEVCIDKWTEVLNQHREKGSLDGLLNKNQVPDECMSPRTEYSYGGIDVVVVPHAPVPHKPYKLKLNEYQKRNTDHCNPTNEVRLEKVDRTKNDKWDDYSKKLETSPTGRPYEAVYLGPIPWLTTAYVIDAPLLISAWKHGDDFPSILAEQCVYLVEDTCHTVRRGGQDKQIGWGHYQMHEKLGVSADTTKKWVCFGDSNHRFSEITHAGITICIKVPNLWKIMHSAVRSINNHNVISTFESGCPLLFNPEFFQPDIETIDNPITKWHFYEVDPRHEGENNNNSNDGSDDGNNNNNNRRGMKRNRRQRYDEAGYKDSEDSEEERLLKRHKHKHSHQTKSKPSQFHRREQEKEVKDDNIDDDTDDDESADGSGDTF